MYYRVWEFLILLGLHTRKGRGVGDDPLLCRQNRGGRGEVYI